MIVGEWYRVKPSAEGKINSYYGPVPYNKVKDLSGEFIGININTNLPVIDFGPLGPFNFTCDIPQEHLELSPCPSTTSNPPTT